MPNKTLDFTKVKKSFLTITFPDESKIMIRQPSKKVMESLVELGEKFDQAIEGEDQETIDEIYQACAEIMSNNASKRKIETSYLSDALDLEDINTFFIAYVQFVSSIAQVKN